MKKKNHLIYYSPSLFVYNTQKKFLGIEFSFFSIFKRVLRLGIYLVFFFLFFFSFNIKILIIFITLISMFIILNYGKLVRSLCWFTFRLFLFHLPIFIRATIAGFKSIGK